MTQRYDYEAGEYVEFSDRWSYAELRSVDALGDVALMEFIGRKLVDVRLTTIDGEFITTPAEFLAQWQQLDARTFHWLVGVSVMERQRIGALGEAKLRSLLQSFVEQQTTNETGAATS